MKIAYQIGSVSLFGTLVDTVTLSGDSGWIVKRSIFDQAGGFYTHTPARRRIAQDTKVSIQGTVVAKNLYSVDQTISRLKALGGLRDTCLIAYDFSGDPLASMPIRWLFTRGSVTDVKDNSEYMTTDEGFYKREITIEMSVDPSWQPLLSSFWEYRQIRNFEYKITGQAGVDNLFSHPEKLSEVRTDSYFYEWPDTLSTYTPLVWPSLYTEEGYGTDYDDFKTFYVLSHDAVWASPPKAVYAFTDLLPQGTLSITVNEETSTLDLEELDFQLQSRGYSGLQVSDEIFVGMTTPFSSFVQRNNAILTQFVPQWVAPGRYPGEVFTGLNEITISGENTTGQAAVNILFGAL
jgi:hypothetical protein